MAMEIRTSPAIINYETINARLEFQSETARLEFRQQHAKINIHTELPRVLIDQYECFASAGLKNMTDLTREIAERAKQHVLEYIGKTAGDGTRLAAIERRGNPIRDIVLRDAYPIHEFGLDFIPKARPKIDVTGSQKFELEGSSEGYMDFVQETYTPAILNLNYFPGKVEYSMKQYASIQIQYTGNNVDTAI